MIINISTPNIFFRVTLGIYRLVKRAPRNEHMEPITVSVKVSLKSILTSLR